ncbi:MAG: TIGR02679 domain-containing protein [Alicyclobacillaceae bacterium]|nr:TIGR02679 domain-containing protein [Alicyclobacillaceae bacterium]
MEALESYLQQPALKRLWMCVKDKYEQLGRVGGKVSLQDLTLEEADALAGLLARNLYGYSTYTVSLQELNQALFASRYRISLVECLQCLFPDLTTRLERSEAASGEWLAFVAFVSSLATTDSVKRWLQQLESGNGPGYRTFLECFREFSRVGASVAWAGAIRALDKVALHLVRSESHSNREGPGDWPVRLPVLAARVMGNPHGLDRPTLAGKLFYWGLEALVGNDMVASEDTALRMGADDRRHESAAEEMMEAREAPSEQARMLYRRAGVLLDDVSSIVWVANWPEVSAYPVAVPLFTVERLGTFEPPEGKLFILENPSVFAELLPYVPSTVPIVCTSGQPSVAALRLLDQASTAGAQMFYSGDFDVKGLQMAITLQERYGRSLRPWRMDSATYRRAVSEDQPLFTEVERNLMEQMSVIWDEQLLPTMLSMRRKVFQEHLVSVLQQDVQDCE